MQGNGNIGSQEPQRAIVIKGKVCIDGTPVEGLPDSSRKKIVKICDLCLKEAEINYSTITSSRKRRGQEVDYCNGCSVKFPYKGEERPKTENNYKGHSKLNTRFTTAGYVKVRDEKGIYMDEHRLAVEKDLGRALKTGEVVHHINGVKEDNALKNLHLCENSSEHEGLHKQLMSLAFELVEKNYIKFNSYGSRYYLPHQLQLDMMEQSLPFSAVSIKQKPNACLSRSDADTHSEVIKGVKLKIPLIASNMSTVTNSSFCNMLYDLGALGVIHRAMPEELILEEVRKVSAHCDWTAASIGTGPAQFDLCKKLVKNGANIIFIDIAHGYSQPVIDLGKKIKKEFPTVKLVLGNTTNKDMLYEVYQFADALKVGIGSGLACTTKDTASCFEQQFSAVHKFKEDSVKFELPIISDGGIRRHSDFTKAIAAGASSVMAGSIFAACPESAAELSNNKKLYAGMASEYVQKKWRGGLKKGTCAEGKVVMLDVGPPLSEMLTQYEGALRSGITYTGASNVKQLQEMVEFIKV
jgi:IMP dehydrogenase/GMP reductase